MNLNGVITSPPCDYVARKGLLDSRSRGAYGSPLLERGCPRACTLTAALTSRSSMSPQCGQEWTRTCNAGGGLGHYRSSDERDGARNPPLPPTRQASPCP